MKYKPLGKEQHREHIAHFLVTKREFKCAIGELWEAFSGMGHFPLELRTSCQLPIPSLLSTVVPPSDPGQKWPYSDSSLGYMSNFYISVLINPHFCHGTYWKNYSLPIIQRTGAINCLLDTYNNFIILHVGRIDPLEYRKKE